MKCELHPSLKIIGKQDCASRLRCNQGSEEASTESIARCHVTKIIHISFLMLCALNHLIVGYA